MGAKGKSMWGLSRWRSARTLFLIVLLFCAPLLRAQTRLPHKTVGQRQATVFPASLAQKTSDLPLLASFSHNGFLRIPQYPRDSAPQMTTLTPPPAASPQTVNFNLLLPSPAGKFTSFAAAKTSLERNSSSPSAFATNAPASDDETTSHFADPEYFTRHIPGVGPIVERVLQQSKAHPRLTRVIQAIQPRF